MCLGAAGLVILAGYDLSIWTSQVSDGARVYLPQRLLCSLVMATDLPLLQITIAGAVAWYLGINGKN
jgi:hypothetical protein